MSSSGISDISCTDEGGPLLHAETSTNGRESAGHLGWDSAWAIVNLDMNDLLSIVVATGVRDLCGVSSWVIRINYSYTDYYRLALNLEGNATFLLGRRISASGCC